jgi:hypothetical protein
MGAGSLPTTEPRDGDVYRALARAVAGGIHTMSVATVVSYDATSSPPRATVRLIPCNRRMGEGGVDECFRVPPLTGCPVIFPGAGAGIAITWPLAAGDTVAVLVAERSIAEWLETGGDATEPSDPRRHDYSDAFILPGALHVAATAPADMHDPAALVAFASSIKLGSAAAASAVALQPEVTTDLETLEAAVLAGSTAAGAIGDVAQWSAFSAAFSAALTAWPAAAGAAKVQAE